MVVHRPTGHERTRPVGPTHVSRGSVGCGSLSAEDSDESDRVRGPFLGLPAKDEI